MIKNILSAILFFALLPVTAQEFENLSNEENIDMVLVTRDMFELITEMDSGNQNDMKNFYNQLEYLASFGSSDPKSAGKIVSKAGNYIKRKSFKLLTKIKDENKTAEFFYIPSGKAGYAKELLLLIRFSNGKTSLLHVKGNINMKRLSLLALQATMLDKTVLKKAEKAVR